MVKQETVSSKHKGSVSFIAFEILFSVFVYCNCFVLFLCEKGVSHIGDTFYSSIF